MGRRTLFFTFLMFAMVAASRQAPAQDFKAMLQERLSNALANKHEDYKHDHRSTVRAPVTRNVLGKKGKEFTGYGTTGVPTITGSAEGDGLNTVYIYDCEIPWEGHWVLKNWHITGYDKEEKNASGKYKLKLKVHLVGGKIEFLEAHSLTDLAHDSRKMPVNALESAIFKNENYMRDQLFP